MTDEKPMEDSRRREDAAIRLEQQFKDFLVTYESDKQETKDWREKYDERLKPIEDMKKLFERPAKAAGVIFILMATPMLGIFGWNFFKWLVHQLDKFTFTNIR